jgi:hypothetical protein
MVGILSRCLIKRIRYSGCAEKKGAPNSARSDFWHFIQFMKHGTSNHQLRKTNYYKGITETFANLIYKWKKKSIKKGDHVGNDQNLCGSISVIKFVIKLAYSCRVILGNFS